MKFLITALIALGMSNAYGLSIKDAHGNEHFLGLKRDSAKLKAFKATAQKQADLLKGLELVIPGKYDLSAKVSLPENQGSCGSCWDFSLTKALRSALMLVGKDPGVLAFNYLLNNCGPGPKMWGCNGGDFPAGQSFLNSAGPWLESQDRYTQREGRCADLPKVATALKMTVVGDGQHKPTFKELAAANSQDHMLSIDVAVCRSWGSYQGGIFSLNECGAESINHMINMNGYDCQTSVDAHGNCVFDAAGKPKNGDGFLIVMNNWGESGWGEVNPTNGHGGYMRTRWGVDAVADTAVYFEVDAPPVPTPTPPTPTPPPVPPGPGPSDNIPFWIWIIIGVLGGGLIVALVVKK